MDDRMLFSSIVELGKALRAKKVSSVELTRAYLDRLQTQGKELNAVAEMTTELALKQAAEADRQIARGQLKGPLHGIPYGAKDLLATKGIPTRWGSPAHKDQIFDFDATVIARLREAGAVLVAKLAMIELAGGGGYEYANASLHGPCKNPWNPNHWAGGSSSGSGAAVGTGAVAFAIGSETWGSITVPAAFCGITGLRPTYGRVSRHGAMALSWTMDKLGSLAHSAEDCALILQAIAGHDSNDPGTTDMPFRHSFSRWRRFPFRLGLLKTDFRNAPDAQKAFDEVMGVFKKQGYIMKDTPLPDYPYNEAADLIITAEAASAFENLIRSPKLNELIDKAQVHGLLAGMAVQAVDYLRAMRIRALAMQDLRKVFEQVDVLVAPTLLQGALPIDKNFNETWVHMGGNGGFSNLAGFPSISVPMGFTGSGLPLGLEMIGAPYEEERILALARIFQSETDWHKRYPVDQ
jgi:aspartyl-tRNA(Asn)/glutamyl-tRNA(Gln) amidotransferase subunit A